MDNKFPEMSVLGLKTNDFNFLHYLNQENGQVDPWQPSDMLHCSPGTADKFAEEYDRFGDSYTQDATVESLKEVFNNVQNQVATPYSFFTLLLLRRDGAV